MLNARFAAPVGVLALLVAVVVATSAGADPSSSVDPRGVDPASPNPLVGLRFYVDHSEPAYHLYRRYRHRGMRRRAALIWRIAKEPRFKWFGRWTRGGGGMVHKVRSWLRRAHRTQPGSVPLMVVMRHQGKGCGASYTGGGAREDARHRKWIRRFARAIGGRRVVIGYEPDSLGTVDCLSRSRRMARLRLLRYGVDVLSKLPNATIYLEGGASDWEPARRTAWQLRYIGISKVRGFMLNVTHFDWTVNNVRHGLRISRLTGGKPFIVSTAFNGRGPIHVRTGSRHRINVWCNPRGRGLGRAPTTDTMHPKVDAYMWIGRPGYSAGGCNGGRRRVGSWWPTRALTLARYATAWERPPR
ncbi:MAG: glycoside hydrolase family 6 protein [Thermoleophilaceae bacterium]